MLFPFADIRVLRHQPTNEIPIESNGSFSCIEDAILFSPDIAVVSNPAPYHVSTAKRLAANGVHLLIEKPLTTSIDEVPELLAICERCRVVLLTGYNLRFLPSLQKFKETLISGIIGEILSVRSEIGQYLPDWRPGTDYRKGVSARRDLGGGALFELSHEIDYLRWIFGEVKWVIATQSKQSKLDIDVDDTCHLILTLNSPLSTTELIASVNLDMIRRDATRRCTAIGEDGSLSWDGLTGEVMLYKSGQEKWLSIYENKNERDASYRAEWENFIACVTGTGSPIVSGLDGLKTLEVLMACRHSATLGSRVPVVSGKN